MKHRLARLLLPILVFNLLFAVPPASRASAPGEHLEDGSRKVLVDAADPGAAGRLFAEGAKKLADYGAFSLWNAHTDALSRAHVSNVQEVQDDGIFLRGVTLLPGQSEPPAARGLAPALAEEEALWLVQFIGPILPEWQEALLSMGLEIVAYVPENAYVIWGSRPAETVEALSRSTGAVQYSGAYLPAYRLSPELRPLVGSDGGDSPSMQEQSQTVTVQFYQTPRLETSIDALQALAVQVIQPPEALLNTTIMRVELSPQALAEVAAWPDVLNIEPYSSPELLDEIQGQILAGNTVQLSGAVLPYAPGYLAWLASKDFPTQPDAYLLVDITDDGLDNGSASSVLHPDFYQFGSKANPSRVAYINNCTGDPSGNGLAGHGNLNVGILAGYNNLQGAPYQDAQGYRLGLGISPYGQVASTKLFNNNGQFDIPRCNNSPSQIISTSYQAGARITSNSWGRVTSGTYTTDSQVFDALTRDASSDPGSQEMLHIFAAGNGGPGTLTVNSPGTAKNIITVGAVENVRDQGTADGCSIIDANSADDVARYSSRGPAADGRVKPDIVAPGTHVQAQASQATGYTGAGVCGGYQNALPSPFYPTQQTLYTWSSGTSHATPAIAGVAQLAANYYWRVLRPGQNPSPAMIKALILNTPRYLNGADAGDRLPSPNQGWGIADMGRMFDSTARLFVDQSFLFSRTGETFTLTDQVNDPSRPFHVSLVWTDAPGSPIAQRALVNDLDLEVIVNGQTYRGNVFSGNLSVADGSADRLNNVENVFLPAGISGSFEVRVIARSIAGNGVPDNDALFDQDFALVIYNAGTGMLESSFYFPFMISGNTAPR